MARRSPGFSTVRGGRTRRLLVLFGDQLDLNVRLLKDLDAQRDAVLMMEVEQEATHVRSHKQRTVLFLSAMRHFAQQLGERDYRVRYVTLDDDDNTQCFEDEITRAVDELSVEELHFIHPGAWRVMQMIDRLRDVLACDVQVHEDEHFLLPMAEFRDWARGRKSFLLEHFYRMMRRRLNVLVDGDGQPEGGQWNYDKQNRKRWDGEVTEIPHARRFRPDAITIEVMELVERRFPDAPGSLDSFHWPVTRKEALAALRGFISNRLPHFGPYQDAMVQGQPWMFHSLLSSSLNLKLLNPRECVDKAVKAFHSRKAPLNSVEGFVRQIIGWREFIRGVYWWAGPDYRKRNALLSKRDLPWMYWSGETAMNCMRQCIGEVLDNGFGHHIQRLMVTGNFALIAGVDPEQVSDWYLAMYVDAVDWVTLPNALGMVMHADNGIVGTKPYAAGGHYISRMSDYCESCRYDPKRSVGEDACPFTTLYWDFLDRHEQRFDGDRRMALAVKNLQRKSDEQRKAIRRRAQQVLKHLD